MGWIVEKIIEIVAGTKAVCLAMNKNRPHTVVRFRIGKCLRQIAIHVRGQRVLFVGPIEHNARDAINGFGQDIASQIVLLKNRMALRLPLFDPWSDIELMGPRVARLLM